MTLIGLRALVGRAARAALVSASLLVPATAGAQGQSFVRVTGSFEQLYDDNLFAAPLTAPQQPGLISRFGPAVEAGYRSIPVKLVVRYGFDAERHITLPELDEAIARQDALVDFAHQTKRLTLTVGTSYQETQAPRELNQQSLLAVGRARAQRITARPGLVYELTALTKVKLDHNFSADALAGGVSSATHVSRSGIDRRLDARNVVRFDYRFRNVAFSDGLEERSHLATAGWTFEIAPSTSVEIDAGPRVTRGSGGVEPEVSLVLKHRLRQGEFSFSYARTLDTAIGESGTIDVHRLGTVVSFVPTRYFTLTASPAWVSSARDVRRTVVHALDLEGRVRATR
ncbi:MAG TPA: hypothetical protein VFO58_15300, partial [Vicinamibacterales bacterium]|nr:hypothetical protein [Vicinamibacterales bacterium]